MDRPQRSLRVAARSKIEWLAGKLSRVTSTGELIPEVDGLRFIAISVVLFHHLLAMFLSGSGRSPAVRTHAEWAAAAGQSWLVTLAYCGHFGVNLFFVISGFILALPFAKRAFNEQAAPGLKSYYLFRLRSAAARRSLLIASIVGFGLLSQCVIYPSGSARLRLTLLNFAHYFLTGFLLVDLYLTGRLRGADKRLAW